MVTLEQFRYIPTHAMRPSACYDFHYARPGMVAIFGENGSGKSTLAQLMAGWYPDFLPGEIEGAGTLNVSGRGAQARIITDLNQPWGTSDTCTKCGKCVMACPTGALFYKGATVGEMERDRTKLEFIVTAREKKQWIAD